jgi:hypothetical protein
MWALALSCVHALRRTAALWALLAQLAPLACPSPQPLPPSPPPHAAVKIGHALYDWHGGEAAGAALRAAIAALLQAGDGGGAGDGGSGATVSPTTSHSPPPALVAGDDLAPRACSDRAGPLRPPPLLVVGADVLFASLCVRPVLRSLRWLLRWGGAGAPHDDSAGSVGALPWADRVGLVVDPGRFSRDDFQALAGEEGLRVVVRVDASDVPTPWTVMKEATVMVVALQEGGSAAGVHADAVAPGSLLHAVCAAVTSWQERAGVGTDDAAGGGGGGRGRYGYVMPVA